MSSSTVEVLRQLGLDNNEVKTYLALVELGETTTGPIIKKTSIPSSKVYSILGSLATKGVVGYILRGGVKYFRPSRPIALRHLLDLQEQKLETTKSELERVLPGLEAEFAEEKPEYKVELMEGLRGIKTVYDLALELAKKGERMYTIGYPLLASELLNAYFKQYHKKLSKKGINARIIYDYETWFGKAREPRPHAEQRYLPQGIRTPAFMHIFQDYVGLMVVTDKQKLCILIKNKQVAESYLQYFELLWGVAHNVVD